MSEYEFEVVVGLVLALCVINFVAFGVIIIKLSKLDEKTIAIGGGLNKLRDAASLIESRSRFLMESKEREASACLKEATTCLEEAELARHMYNKERVEWFKSN